MLGKFFDWLDHRTGYRKLMDAMLLEHIPGGAKWRYVWGSCLAFVFMIQLITGVLLMTAYSPGENTAWGSVYFIQYEMDFGWLIRGLHHFGSQTMVVLLGLHMLQVVIAGAHLPPREINWWLGLALMGVVLGLSLTGYLLPWDQKGYYATRVATNIAGNIPGVGDFIKRMLVGGTDFGHHTLTRFFTMHVGILPPLLIVLLIAHLAVFRRHGVTAPANAQGEGYFWPDQAFRDMIMCLVVFGIMLSLVLFGGHGNKIDVPPPPPGQEPGLLHRWAQMGKEGLGANLDAPADRETPEYPARPEWYFLFLFQLLKYFKGDLVLVGTVIIPNGVMVLLFLLPLFGYGRMRAFGHMLGVLLVVLLLASVAALTALALADDSPEPWPLGLGGGTTEAKGFHHRTEEAAKLAQRAVQLAKAGIPEEGARLLLRNDPLTRGPKLFERNCASCHMFTPDFANKDVKYTAPDLAGFGTEKWVKGLLEKPGDVHYFGAVKDDKGELKLKGMIGWRKKIDDTLAEWKMESEGQKKIDQLNKELDDIAKWLAQQKLPRPKRDKELEKAGSLAFVNKKGANCRSCHTAELYLAKKGEKDKDGNPVYAYEEDGGSDGPSLVGWGSQDWIRFMVMSPSHETRYGGNNQMTAFRNLDGPGSEVLKKEFQDKYASTKLSHLSDIDRELILRWLVEDYRTVFGGAPISGPPLKK